MTTRRTTWIATAAVLALALGAAPLARQAPVARLSDQEFRTLIDTSSEPSGAFHSENLVSNEARFQGILPALTQATVPGRAYVGVGSEQNFTYIAAIRPVIAFIVDLRRGNLDLHLAYKALFEMSADRAEFVSRLFSRPRPAGLSATSTAAEIFDAYSRVAADESLYVQNVKAIETHLLTRHGYALSEGDREGLTFVYRSWFEGGPELRYQLTNGIGPGPGAPGGRAGRGAAQPPGGRRGGFGPGGVPGMPTYADLMTADDGTGKRRSYLATEENFKFLKDLETRNLVIPVVGNFAGPKALRAVATYLKQHKQIVSVFYLSNVEQYLRQDGIWDAFCANAATLPIDKSSVFIRSERGGAGFGLDVMPMAPDLAACARK